MGNPVIFVHGIGASASVWKKFNIPDHPIFYISFSDRFADPARQVPELKGIIDRVLRETRQNKVILVCHSLGGLVARKYLIDFKASHKVEKLILLSTPNLGSMGLSFNWLPLLLIILGALGYRYLWPLLFGAAGLIWEMVSYARGVWLLSEAAWAMRPRSRFLRELNSKEMPEDIKYVSILSDTRDWPHHLANLLLFREGGDGAVPLSSQRLSPQCVPNFSRLDYSELHLNLPHFAIPRQAAAAILQALKL
jgi:pimeloyl-ACP methyl ester carboxylesterase